ncbi:uncharacterized protein [Dermacentor albipictus]
MDQNEAKDTERPTASGANGQPATPAVEVSSLTRTRSVDSQLPLLASFRDVESAASTDVASTTIPLPNLIAELHVDPAAAHPPAVTATTVDLAAHAASSTTRPAVAPAPSAAATAAEASRESQRASSARKTKRRQLLSQEPKECKKKGRRACLQTNMDQHKAKSTERPTAGGVKGQPATPAAEAPSLTRIRSVDSAFPLLASLRDAESTASAAAASTLAPAPLPNLTAELHVDPKAHPPAVTATTLDLAARAASSTTRAAVAPAPSAAATATEASSANRHAYFAWVMQRKFFQRQSDVEREVLRLQEAPWRASNEQPRPEEQEAGGGGFGRTSSDMQIACTGRIYPCEVCRYHFDVNLDRRQVLFNWFRDSNNLENHLSFLCGLIFTIGLAMSLTFFWLEYAHRTTNMSWLLTVPLGIAFAFHSIVWLSAASFFLWLYPKAFWTWKQQTLLDISRALVSLATRSDMVADQLP